MSSNRAGTISGYNEYIQGLRADKDTEYTVSLTQFDAPMTNPELTVSYLNRALADVPVLGEADYEPRGNTPLYDAIGECIRRVDSKDRVVIALIVTDGMENASIEFTKDTIKALIEAKKAQGWTFAFLGADIDSYAVGGAVGVPAMNTANYAKGNERMLYQTLASATIGRAASVRSVGVQAAASEAFLDDEQRSALVNPENTGGRPAAPPTFPKPEASPVAPKRRNWDVRSA